LRRILVRLQGAPNGAYCLYVTFGATPKAGQKTSKIVDLFISEALRARAKITSHFKRRCIPAGGVAKARNMPDIPALSRLARRAPQHLKL